MAPQARPVTLERNFHAPIASVWDLWTSTAGIEAWWGPDGFAVTVKTLDLRPGGTLVYVMTATEADQVDFLKKAGMPVSQSVRLTFTEVDPPRVLAFSSLVDFIPNTGAYKVATRVVLEDSAGSVRMVVTLDAMHDDHWTDLAVRGWESQLDRLGRLLTQGTPPGASGKG